MSVAQWLSTLQKPLAPIQLEKVCIFCHWTIEADYVEYAHYVSCEICAYAADYTCSGCNAHYCSSCVKSQRNSQIYSRIGALYDSIVKNYLSLFKSSMKSLLKSSNYRSQMSEWTYCGCDLLEAGVMLKHSNQMKMVATLLETKVMLHKCIYM